MSFRGLGLSQGFEKYGDLLAQAAKDRIALENEARQRQFANSVQAQQAATLYGYSGPEVQGVPSPVPLPQQQSPYQDQSYVSTQELMRDPAFADPVQDQSEAMLLSQDLKTGRVTNPQQQMPPLEQAKTKALQYGVQGGQQPKGQEIGQQVDQMIAQLVSQPGVIRNGMIRPDVAKRIQDLQDMKIKSMGSSENGLYNQMMMEMARQEGRASLAAQEAASRAEIERLKAKLRPDRPPARQAPSPAIKILGDELSRRQKMIPSGIDAMMSPLSVEEERRLKSEIDSISRAQLALAAGVVTPDQALQMSGIVPNSSQKQSAPEKSAPKANKKFFKGKWYTQEEFQKEFGKK